MSRQEFSGIYGAFKSISSNNYQNKDEVIQAVQEKLIDEDKNSDLYKEWEKGRFSLDHVFTYTNDYNNKIEHTLLTHAFNKPDLDLARFLIKVGADVNIAGEGGWTPLVIAIEKNAQDLIDYLLEEANADIDAAGENGGTPIVKAVERGRLNVFNSLVERGADLNVKNEWGLLAWAVMHVDCTKRLEEMIKITETILKKSSGISTQDVEMIQKLLPRLSKSTKQEMKEIVSKIKAFLEKLNESHKDSSKEENVSNTSVNNNEAENTTISPKQANEPVVRRDNEDVADAQGTPITLKNGGKITEESEKKDKSDIPTVNRTKNTQNHPDSQHSNKKNTVGATPVNSNTNTNEQASGDTTSPKTSNEDSQHNNEGNAADATPVNSNTNTNEQATEKTSFFGRHKGKIALTVAVLCMAGAVAAYMLGYPIVVASVLAALAAAILTVAGVVKACEKSPGTEKSDMSVSKHIEKEVQSNSHPFPVI